MKDGKNVILAIDDDPDILDTMRTIMESDGHVVETAPTAEDGIRAFKSAQPDMIIVDLMMEEIDAGTNFVREVRALGSQVPIYMVTSVGDEMNMNTAYSDLGLSGIIQKPIQPATLLATIKAKLG
jgi:DNA-binding response OmpR family regulator